MFIVMRGHVTHCNSVAHDVYNGALWHRGRGYIKLERQYLLVELIHCCFGLLMGFAGNKKKCQTYPLDKVIKQNK